MNLPVLQHLGSFGEWLNSNEKLKNDGRAGKVTAEVEWRNFSVGVHAVISF